MPDLWLHGLLEYVRSKLKRKRRMYDMEKPLRTRRAPGRLACAIALAGALLLLALASCGVPLRHLNAVYDANAHSRWIVRESRLLTADIPYVEDGDPRQIVDIHRVEGEGLRPVVIFVHGGAWQYGDNKLYASLARTLNEAGFVTVLPQYRLYPDATYPAFCEDVAAALNWTMEHLGEYGGDADRVILAGHSAGAHLVSIVYLDDAFRERLTFDPLRIRGIVPMSGPFDFDAGRRIHREGVLNVMGGEEGYRRAMPINHLRADVPPMLVIVGENDRLTPRGQSERFAQLMREAGAPVTHETLPGGDHYSMMIDFVPGHEGPALDRFLDFARERTAPPGPE